MNNLVYLVVLGVFAFDPVDHTYSYRAESNTCLEYTVFTESRHAVGDTIFVPPPKARPKRASQPTEKN